MDRLVAMTDSDLNEVLTWRNCRDEPAIEGRS